MPADPSPPSDLRRVEVDGVPVLWSPAPAPFTAGLVFGVGRRDETYVRGGVTHLVEHLVMSAVGRTTLDCNASVDLSTTEFRATGRPERVVAFLRLVCEALHDLPVDRLAVEADVLRTEDGAVAHPAVGALLAERYGGRGVGLAGFGEPATTALTAQDVRQWAATRFVRGAAVLWLSGPPPEGLALPLPDGPVPARDLELPRPVATPALVEHPVDGIVSLGAEVVASPGLAAALRILSGRLEDDLRHGRGLSYSVVVDHLVLAAERRFVALRADCRDGQEAPTARALWRTLGRLADEGPTDDELAYDLELLEEHLCDPRTTFAELQSVAAAVVGGRRHRSSADLLAEGRSLSAEQVRSAAHEVRAGALLGVPAGVEASVPGLAALAKEQPREVHGRVHPPRPLGSDAPRGARLVIGDDGVSMDLGEGDERTVRYADALALLELTPGEWTLVGEDGTSVPLSPGDWRDGRAALDRVRATVPAELQVAADQLRTSARRVLLVHAPPYAAAEALWPSRSGAWLLQTDSWTAVVREQSRFDAQASAAGMSAGLGRRGAVLVLEQAYGELSVEVLHRGTERDRHVWTGEAHDPGVLAELLGADPEQVAALLAVDGPPSEVLVELTRVLGVPEQVGQVLAGVPVSQVPGFVHAPPRGVRESFTATLRGEYDPPDSPLLRHRLTRWERDRPPTYRALNFSLAAAQAALAGVVASRADGPLTRRRKAVVAWFAVGAVGNLWSVRPPSRPRD